MVIAKCELDSYKSVAILAITRNGVGLALQLQARFGDGICYVPSRYQFAIAAGAVGFESLRALMPEVWSKHDAIICIMATGIVVRQIASLLKNKRVDPAVVVLDEKGSFVISLLSGHLGGANQLAEKVAQIVGGHAVITTASDVQKKPAIDLIAREVGLEIENPEMLAPLTRSILDEEKIWIYDPDRRLGPYFSGEANIIWLTDPHLSSEQKMPENALTVQELASFCVTDLEDDPLGIWVSEHLPSVNRGFLFLRPRNLVVGLGCNRGTSPTEVMLLLQATFEQEKLSTLSIRNFASIELKADEPGIVETAKAFERPIFFYSGEEIGTVSVPNPSDLVKTHVGVPSVCEATALMSAQTTKLVITKRKTANATIAVARADYQS